MVQHKTRKTLKYFETQTSYVGKQTEERAPARPRPSRQEAGECPTPHPSQWLLLRPRPQLLSRLYPGP